MRPRIRRSFSIIGRVVAGTIAAAVAFANTAVADASYPTRAIRLIVPFPPGGPTDVMGRLISQALSDQLGQQVYVDNRPGAGSTLAGKIAASAEPDGYTLLLGSAATLARSGRRSIATPNTTPRASCQSQWSPTCLT
jgi:tripartite-type tricarboxylate transporter receptor subunit TctC